MEASQALVDPTAETQVENVPVVVDPAPGSTSDPAPVDPAPEPALPSPELEPIVPQPEPAKVFLSDGQAHLLADRADLVGKLIPADAPPADWLVLTRQNGSTITVRETAIVAYE
jgi:hypothetical protein